MKKEELYTWLFDCSGPVIRYRTAAELMPSGKKPDLSRLMEEMLQSKQVKVWLENIVPPKLLLNEPDDVTPHVMQSGIMEIHGSQPTQFENVLGKLTDFGLKKGIAELDQRTLPYRNWLAEKAEHPLKNVFAKSNKLMLAPFLARAGYTDEPGVEYTLKNRLDMVHDFTRKRDYDIYIPGKIVRKHPVVKPEITPGGEIKLPLICDIIGWAAYLSECGIAEDREKADDVIRYILDEKYQKLPWGYGLMGDDTGRTWGLRWSVHLPRYSGSPENASMNKSVIQMVNLLKYYEAARQSSWLQESMSHLESFRTEQGTYIFPSEYLEEKKTGYWVNGIRMGLEENRKRNLEVESTFWMAKFQKMLSQKT